MTHITILIDITTLITILINITHAYYSPFCMSFRTASSHALTAGNQRGASVSVSRVLI